MEQTIAASRGMIGTISAPGKYHAGGYRPNFPSEKQQPLQIEPTEPTELTLFKYTWKSFHSLGLFTLKNSVCDMLTGMMSQT